MVEALGRPSGLEEVSEGGDCQMSQSTDCDNNDKSNDIDNSNTNPKVEVVRSHRALIMIIKILIMIYNVNSDINLKVEVVRCLRLQKVKW